MTTFLSIKSETIYIFTLLQYLKSTETKLGSMAWQQKGLTVLYTWHVINYHTCDKLSRLLYHLSNITLD